MKFLAALLASAAVASANTSSTLMVLSEWPRPQRSSQPRLPILLPSPSASITDTTVDSMVLTAPTPMALADTMDTQLPTDTQDTTDIQALLVTQTVLSSQLSPRMLSMPALHT